MAIEKEKDTLDESPSSLQPDHDAFAGTGTGENAEADPCALDTHEQLSEHEVFIGDDDFYKLLAESAPEAAVQQPSHGRRPLRVSVLHLYERLSFVQKVLVASILVVALMLVYASLRPGGGTAAGPPSESARQVAPTTRQASPFESGGPEPRPVLREQESSLLPPRPLSLKVARTFFLQKEYDQARASYEQLREALPASDALLRDFLQLEMALCSKEAGDLEQASRSLAAVSQSRSPAVRIVANYHLSMLEIRRKRFLRAATRAYNAMALIKAADFDDDWALSFECDCHFLVAECLSRHILMLSNVGPDLPDDLWGSVTASSDPFAQLQEAQLRTLLNSGSEHLGTGLLDPKIRELEQQGDLPRWSVTSYGAPIEELMAKFAASADLDLHWAFRGSTGPYPGGATLRQTPVSMHLPAATSRQIVLTATGCAGLLASPEDNPGGKLKVTISDPTDYASLHEHLSFLSRHAVSLWQKFVLTFYSDKRIANAHFAMGLLHSQVGLPTEAIAEFKLVANRFSQASLAPYALLHSSKLKTHLRDHHGAREDLRQLIEQYPDTTIYGHAYLRLADATTEAGLKAEAARLYQRVYNFGLSAESKTASALGAAGCFYETEAYEDAAKWLTRYIQLAGDSGYSNLYSAYFLLGKACMAMEKYEHACSAFQYALAAQSSREQYIEAITALVEGHIEQEQFVEALEALENVSSVSLSEEQSIAMLLLKCRIFRMMGLIETATISLRDRAEYVSDTQLSAKISFELAQCHIAEGDLERARSRLSEILGVVEPGPLAQETSIELADVCLKLGRNSQSISVCLQLLDSDVSSQMRQQTLKTLAAAYSQQDDYDKAALAISGQWK
ncbi:MAG: tetratricopeptide repeat protein [Phycisphaerales bacterium]|nr:MAG: tetratricopeptide repeat protein [Phycisphaerales bacterium]